VLSHNIFYINSIPQNAFSFKRQYTEGGRLLLPPNKKHEKLLKIMGLNAPRALPRICSAYAHSARSAFGALSLLQAKKANEKTTHSGGSFVGLIVQKCNFFVLTKHPI
jgi:hypothetical protein